MNLNTSFDPDKALWESDRIKLKQKCNLVIDIGYMLAYDQDNLIKILENKNEEK